MRKLISLGQSSDVAFQLRMHGEENVTHFFDWLTISVDGVIQILNADFDVFYPDHLELDSTSTPHHVVDRLTNVRFFHQFPIFGGNAPPEFLLFYDAFIKKFRVLAERFRTYVQSFPVTLVRRGIVEAEALALEDAVFQCFPGADLNFLYIVEPGHHFSTQHGTTRSIKDEGSFGDPISWWAALQDEGLIEHAFRHATAEIVQHEPDNHNFSIVDPFSEVQLQTAAAVHADHGKFPQELSRFYMRRQRWDKAEEMARVALARSPGLPNAVFELNYINWKAKKITADEAASAFLVFLETEAYDPIWLTETCAALLEAGRIEEAVVYSGKAVLATPRTPESYDLRAMCFTAQSKFEHANYAIMTALELGEHPYRRHLHATILAELQRWEEAVAVAKAACKLDSSAFYINHLTSLLLRASKSLPLSQPVVLPDPAPVQPAPEAPVLPRSGLEEPSPEALVLPDLIPVELAPTPDAATMAEDLVSIESLAKNEDADPILEPADTSFPVVHQLATFVQEVEPSRDIRAGDPAASDPPKANGADVNDREMPIKLLAVEDMQPAREDGVTPIRRLASLRTSKGG